MKKKVLFLLAVLIFSTQSYSYVSAKSSYVSKSLSVAITKYKKGNYSGCLQDCQSIVVKSPSALAYYYLAMAYVQAGKKNEAMKAYSKVLSLKPNSVLSGYATTGKRCLETPDKCVLDVGDTSELDKFIANPSYDGFSPAVRKDFGQKHLDTIRNDINADKEIDDYSLRKLNQADTIKIAQAKPTDAEVVAALKVLNDAGISNYAKSDSSDYAQYAATQNPEMAQLNALMGGGSQYNNRNSMMDMLPYMISQKQQNGESSYSPQMVQAVIMNSMMTNLNYDVDKDK